MGKFGPWVGCDGGSGLGCKRKASQERKAEGSKDNCLRKRDHRVGTLAKTQGKGRAANTIANTAIEFLQAGGVQSMNSISATVIHDPDSILSI